MKRPWETDIPTEWFEAVLTPEDLEPYAYHPQVVEILEMFEPGDHIRSFTSPPDSWKWLAGRKGFVLLRNNVELAQAVTMKS